MYIARSNGRIEQFTPAGPKLTLEEMQGIVGGYIKFVYPKLNPDVVLIVNEEGYIHNLSINEAASRLYGGPIAGDILLLTRAEYKQHFVDEDED